MALQNYIESRNQKQKWYNFQFQSNVTRNPATYRNHSVELYAKWTNWYLYTQKANLPIKLNSKESLTETNLNIKNKRNKEVLNDLIDNAFKKHSYIAAFLIIFHLGELKGKLKNKLNGVKTNKRNDKRFNSRGYSLYFLIGIFNCDCFQIYQNYWPARFLRS